MKITTDNHVHTVSSLCASREAIPADYLKICKANGINVIGFTDHMWDSAIPGASDWYKPQNMERISLIRDMIPDDIDGIKIMFGCETEYVGNGKIAITKESAKTLDYVLVPPNHFHMKDLVIPSSVTDNAEYKKYLIDRFMEICAIDLGVQMGIAHPFMPLGIPETDVVLASITDDEYIKCFNYAKENGKSIELQTQLAVLDNPEFNRMIKIAYDCGSLFHVGSDSHNMERFNGAHERLGNFLDQLGMEHARIRAF